MSFFFIDTTARAAWAAATSQQGQLEALAALWSGDVWARFYTSAGTHLATVTYGTPTIDTGSTPRAMVLGAWSAESHINPGTAAYVVLAVPSGADILRADVSLAGAISDPGGRVRLDIGTTLRIQATASLPTVELPTWLSGVAVNQWVEITGTSGAGGSAVDAFSGFALVGTQIVIAAAGGHGSGLDNRVVSIDLADNAPAWTTRMAASVGGTNDVAYYSDGKPASRHTYHFIHSITGNKVLLGGVRFTYNGAVTFDNMDAVDLDTNTWDGVVAGAPGTSGSGYSDLNPSGSYPVVKDGDGNLWMINYGNGAAAKYTVSTNTWTSPTITTPVADNVRYPWAWDSTRSQLFGLAWADGEGFGSGLRAVRQNGTTQAAISFNASSALTDLTADVPEYASMVYDPDNDRFLFYEGYSTRAGRVYTITPNGATTWDVGILSTTGATVTGTFGTKGLNHTGVQNRFQRVVLGSVSGVVCLPRGSSNLFFLRTA